MPVLQPRVVRWAKKLDSSESRDPDLVSVVPGGISHQLDGPHLRQDQIQPNVQALRLAIQRHVVNPCG